MTDKNEKNARSRTINRLSARAVETATEPGIYIDGGGLMLRVTETGIKQWLFRYVSPTEGKRREMGFGRADKGFVPLGTARENAKQARDEVARGIDPKEERDRKKNARRAESVTFGQFADEWLKERITDATHRNAKHRDQWRSTLETYAKPIWDKPIATVTVEQIERCLKPIWQIKAETAARTRGRIELVLDTAISKKLHPGPNPARWRGNLEPLLGKQSKKERGKHGALDHKHVQQFGAALRGREGIAPLALEFLILTAARSGEVRGMTWGEIDLEERCWTVPASRMKAGETHRVPLCDRAVEIIEMMTAFRPNKNSAMALVFPGVKDGAPMSDMTLAAILKRMAKSDRTMAAMLGRPGPGDADQTGDTSRCVTVHGFRSTFQDWAEEVARFAPSVVEAALAHKIQGVRASYRRGDSYDIRAELMAAWGSYLADQAGQEGKVLPFRRGTTNG